MSKDLKITYFKGASKTEPGRRAVITVYNKPQEDFFTDRYVAEATYLDCTAIRRFNSLDACKEEFFLSKQIEESEYIFYKDIQHLIEEIYMNQFSGGWPRKDNVDRLSEKLFRDSRTAVKEIFKEEESNG